MNYGIDNYGDVWIDGVRLGNTFTDTSDTIENKITTYLLEQGIDTTRTNAHFHYLHKIAGIV
jgi:hypothetical protein